MRRRKLVAIFGAVLAVAMTLACAQNPVPPTVVAPAPELVSLAKITVERFWYPMDEPADTGQNRADLYLPAGPERADSIPLVVLIHGGAWQSSLGVNVFDGLARELAGRVSPSTTSGTASELSSRCGRAPKNLKANEEGCRPVYRPTRVISLAGPLDMVYAANHGDDHIITVLGGRPSEVPHRYASVDPIQNIDPTVPVIALHVITTTSQAELATLLKE